MSRTPAARDDRPATERLMEAAEILIGQHGVDGVSLRQIGSTAGSSNNYAVQYHFGDAEGLIHAILVKHIDEGEASQRIMLQLLEDQGRLAETRSLLDILLRPILDPLNSAGKRSYARFIVALLNSPEGVQHFRKLLDLAPITGRVVELLQTANPTLPWPILSERLRVVAVMVLSSVFNRLWVSEAGDGDAPLVDDALDMAAAGLTAPVRELRRNGKTRSVLTRQDKA